MAIVLARIRDWLSIERLPAVSVLPVTAAAESVPSGLAAGGGHRHDAGKPREGGLGAQPAAVRPGDVQLRGDDRADTRLLEQRGRQVFDWATREVRWSHPRVPPRSTLTPVCVMLATGG
jgi:hypothetical protein